MQNTVVASAKLPITVPSLTYEVANSNNLWHAHFNKLHYNGNWDVLPLRSPGGSTELCFAETMDQGDFQNNNNLKSFPGIEKLLQQLKCPLLSARLLNLRAGSEIKQHRDHELSFEHGEARLHFPIITNNQVLFYLNNELLQMQVGECWYINANLPHSAINAGKRDRIHLVIDCVVNDWLAGIFNDSKKTFYTYPPDLRQIEGMIKELKHNPSPAAKNILTQLENDYYQFLEK